MSSRIVEVEIAEEQSEMVRFLCEYLPKHVGSRQYEWLYLRNPSGMARAWRLVDDASGATIGVAAAFPRRVWIKNREVICWNLGDFAMHKAHRSLGPAVELQRACLACLQTSEAAFAYDHPSCNMMAIYRWLGTTATGDVIRYALPLRVDDKVRELVPDGMVGRAISAAGNTALRALRRGPKKDDRMAIGKLVGRFDDRATALDRRLATRYLVVGSRTTAYLNWRYLENPTSTYEVFTAEERDRLFGYAVVVRDGSSATLTDLYCDPDSQAPESLIQHVVATLCDDSVVTLSAPMLRGTPLAHVLEQAGFRPRETVPFVVLPGLDAELGATVTNPNNWFYADGDRDV